IRPVTWAGSADEDVSRHRVTIVVCHEHIGGAGPSTRVQRYAERHTRQRICEPVSVVDREVKRSKAVFVAGSTLRQIGVPSERFIPTQTDQRYRAIKVD